MQFSKFLIALVASLALAASAEEAKKAEAAKAAEPAKTASVGKSCDDLKAEVAAKIEAKGVKSYTLDVVAKDAQAEGKVVGSCGGGTKKIVYAKK